MPARAMPRRLRSWRLPVLLLAVAATLAGCGLTAVTGPRSWAVSTTGINGKEVVVSIADRSGKVTGIEVDPADAVAGGGVTAVPGQPNQLDVPWTGGSCDKLTEIGIDAAGAGLTVNVKVTPDETLVCDAMGVLRTLRLTLNAPIAPALVTVRQ